MKRGASDEWRPEKRQSTDQAEVVSLVRAGEAALEAACVLIKRTELLLSSDMLVALAPASQCACFLNAECLSRVEKKTRFALSFPGSGAWRFLRHRAAPSCASLWRPLWTRPNAASRSATQSFGTRLRRTVCIFPGTRVTAIPDTSWGKTQWSRDTGVSLGVACFEQRASKRGVFSSSLTHVQHRTD